MNNLSLEPHAKKHGLGDIEQISNITTSMEIRLYMKDKGWDSKDTISKIGWGDEYGYSIWFERSDWHGRRTFALTGSRVSFHYHTDNLDEDNINFIVKTCALQALKAYDDFPNSIPCMNAKGKTVPDLMVGDWNDEKCLIKKTL